MSLLRPPHESEVHSTLANPYVAKFKASSKHSAAASTHGAGRPCSAQLPRWPPGTPARPARPPESRSRRGFQKRRSSVKDEGGALGLLIDGAKKNSFSTGSSFEGAGGVQVASRLLHLRLGFVVQSLRLAPSSKLKASPERWTGHLPSIFSKSRWMIPDVTCLSFLRERPASVAPAMPGRPEQTLRWVS